MLAAVLADMIPLRHPLPLPSLPAAACLLALVLAAAFDVLPRLTIPGLAAGRHAGQAHNLWDVCGTLLLHMLARPILPMMSAEHPCWICWPGLQY